MEFKEAMKIRKRMCGSYEDCNGCPLKKFEEGCITTLFVFREFKEIDEYEKILEEWAKEHPVVTNADKYIGLIKNTFGTKLNRNKNIRCICPKTIIGRDNDCDGINCPECMKWWDEEYKEPVKEKEE